MHSYSVSKQELLNINDDLHELLSIGASVPGAAVDALSDWKGSCRLLRRQLSEEILRIAVVGTIKSGKSTFLNSLLGGDYLKRGAGVVTSIVTRIHHGSEPVSRLIFKSWSEVNQDITQALALMPAAQGLSETGPFDIRDAESRKALRAVLEGLPVDQALSHESRNLNSVLLASYLEGYERIKNIVEEDNLTRHFDKERFVDHWQYAGSDSMAVYLKDLQLEIDSRHLDSDTEFADCQGSDSPNPLHLAMIQDYLQQAHLTLYVVSSRTGVRDADIKFLSIIRKMGLGETVLLVVNADISEHETLSDLGRLTERIVRELDLIIPRAPCFTLSALYHLFETLGDRLAEKDRMRLKQWDYQADLADYSRSEFRRFQEYLRHRLLQKRYQLMVKSQIQRHGIILDGISDWIRISRRILSRSDGNARQFLDALADQRERIQQMTAGIESTTAGAVPKIKSELNVDVDRFFDPQSGSCIRHLLGFIRDYRVDFGKYQENLDDSGFLHTLDLVFQEFKQALDANMAHSVYPTVVNFVRDEEEKIGRRLRDVLEPYQGIVVQGLGELRKALVDFDADTRTEPLSVGFESPDIQAVKSAAALRLPSLVTLLQYSRRIKAEAFIHAGYFSVIKVVKKMFRYKTAVGVDSYARALEKSVRRMKKQTEESILFECKNFRENLKFSYLHKLVEAVTQSSAANLTDRFRAFGAGTAVMVDHVGQMQSDRDNALAAFQQMDVIAAAAGKKIGHLRHRVEDPEADTTVQPGGDAGDSGAG